MRDKESKIFRIGAAFAIAVIYFFLLATGHA
jgi:hypothetical protein